MKREGYVMLAYRIVTVSKSVDLNLSYTLTPFCPLLSIRPGGFISAIVITVSFLSVFLY